MSVLYVLKRSDFWKKNRFLQIWYPVEWLLIICCNVKLHSGLIYCIASVKLKSYILLIVFWIRIQGTRSALYSNDRESITVTVEEVTPRSVGALVALYERAVGIYASLVNINAYHQPGKNYPACQLGFSCTLPMLLVFYPPLLHS